MTPNEIFLALGPCGHDGYGGSVWQCGCRWAWGGNFDPCATHLARWMMEEELRHHESTVRRAIALEGIER